MAEPAPDRVGQRLGRFVLEWPLGAGGMGNVYRAEDTRLKRQVAIKILRSPGAEHGDARRRLLREAQAAAALDHPNICPIYEIGEADDVSFIVMAYVDGETLADTVARRNESTPRASLEADALAILTQIAAALGEAHRHGIVHRDIKPANVMLTARRVVKVVDFGLASATSALNDAETRAESFSKAGFVAGTIGYMSPEQIRSETLDPRTDIFSVGVVAYELFTGRHPFRGPTPADTIAAILTLEPEALSDRDAMSADMRRIVHKCLEKRRDDRYATAEELLADLASVADRGPASNATIAASAPLPAPPMVAAALDGAEFVGREIELDVLAGLWGQTTNGQRTVALVGGEPGIGKTRIATEFARRCAGEGATVLAGRADQEALIPYQPIVEALTWYVRACPESELVAQLRALGGGGELSWIVPELRRRIPNLPVPDPVSPESQRYRLFEVVSELLVRASASHPVLLLIDDLHWADQATFQLLRHLLRRPESAALCVVLTFREGEVTENPALSELLVDLRRDSRTTRLSLRGLGEVAVAEIVRSLGGVDAPGLFGRLVAESTGGNPLFVGEVVRHLLGTGGLATLRNIKHLSDVGVPDGVKDVIRRRLSRLSDDCLRVLTLAAVVGRDVDLAILEALGERDEDRLIDLLDEAIRAHVIAPVAGARERITFVHVLFRETLYDDTTGPRRARLHRRVGEALEKLSEGLSKPPLADLAHHFFLAAPAGRPEKAINYALKAGEAAVEALVFEEAIRFFDMAIQTLEPQPPSDEMRAHGAAVHIQRALAFRALGQWAAQKQAAERALASLGAGQTDRHAELTLMLADAAFYLLDLPGTKHWASAAFELGRQVNRDDIAADATGWLARCEQAKGNITGAIELDRKAVGLAGGPGRVTRMHGGHTLYLAGCSAEFADEGSRYVELARASHDAQQVMFATPHLGLALGAVGRYAEALHAFDDARAFGQRYGVTPPLARSISMSAGLRLMLFDYAAAKALATEARELALSINFNPPIVSAGIDLILIAARTGDLGGVDSLLRETTARFETMPGWHEWLWRLRLKQATAEVALAKGMLDQCVADATDAMHLSRTVRPKYYVLARMTRARARIRSGEKRTAINDARRAVVVARRIEDPALLAQAVALLVAIDGNDRLLLEARLLIDRIRFALPDAMLRQHFLEAEPIAGVLSL